MTILNPDGTLTQPARDLLVQSRFRNAILWDALAGRSQTEVADEVGVCKTTFGKLLNLKMNPRYDDGTFRDVAVRVADYFRMLPEDLFPASLYALTLPDSVERTFDSERVMLSLQCAEARMLPDAVNLDEKLISGELTESVDEALGTLTPREEKVIEMRFGLDGNGEHTFEEVGRVFGVGKERIRQIEARALRKLRHPSRTKLLRPFLEGPTKDYL